VARLPTPSTARPLVLLLALTAAVATAARAPAPAGAAARLGERTLHRGQHGADVRELQRTLRRLDLKVSVDGTFGASTDRAVRRYERRIHVPADGRVTPGQARGMRARAGTLALGGRTLRRGDQGKDVRRLQQILTSLGLTTPVDGTFGAATEHAVLLLQQRTAQQPADGRLTRAQAQALARLAAAAATSGAGVPAPAATAAAAAFPIAGPHHRGGAGTGFHDRGGAHQGIDVFADCGTPLVAPLAGTVRRVAEEADAGNYLVLHVTATGEDLVMMHLRHRASVRQGDRVSPGQAVGEVGQSGNADGCHLHFEIWTAPGWYEGGKPRNPDPDLERWDA
jgi:murein DD-endopeptidase MepM/ murein hydrolase activator NlpD